MSMEMSSNFCAIFSRRLLKLIRNVPNFSMKQIIQRDVLPSFTEFFWGVDGHFF